MDTTANGSLLGLLLATLLLNYLLVRFRPRRLEGHVGPDIAQFLAGLAIFGIVWLTMGIIGLVPLFGPLLGSSWLPEGLRQFTGNPILVLVGVCFSGTLMTTLGYWAYQFAAIRTVLASDSFEEKGSKRLVMALAGLYLGTLGLDLVRVLFTSEQALGVTSFSVATTFTYLLIIGCLWTARSYLRRRRIGAMTEVDVIQLGVLLTAGSLVGAVLTNGSVHLGQMNYAVLASELTSTWAGLLLLIATGAISVGTVNRISSTRLPTDERPRRAVSHSNWASRVRASVAAGMARVRRRIMTVRAR